MNAHVLIVDGDTAARQSMHAALATAGFDATAAASGAEAWSHFLEDGTEVAILGLALPDVERVELVRRMHTHAPDTKIVLLADRADRASIEGAVAAVEAGAHAFVEHPFEAATLVAAARTAARMRMLEQRVAYLTEQERKRSDIGTFVHAAPRMAELMRHLEAMARGTVPVVLVTGEDGTGKLAVARALHEASPRSRGPFIELDCSAFHPSQIETELFGRERSSAPAQGRDEVGHKIGLTEIADGGTLFIDDAAELPLMVQARLVALIEQRAFQRVGGRVSHRVDVRVMASTTHDLRAMVAARTFRQDLHSRLEAITLALPPLRERHEDIQALAVHFMTESARLHRRRFKAIAPDAVTLLLSYRWPGNVRELRMVINRAVMRYDDEVLRVKHLSHTVPDPSLAAAIATRSPRASDAKTGIPPLADVELAHIRRVLDLCGGNRTLAAQHLGITRQTLARRIDAAEEAAVDDGAG